MFAPSESLHAKKTSFSEAEDAGNHENVTLQKLKDALYLYPAAKIYDRSSPQFDTLKAVWNLTLQAQPLAICRPTTYGEVWLIVTNCHILGLPLAVRSGGHDVWGRSVIADAIMIDMRELDEITLAKDSKTVTIGGGVTAQNLLAFLERLGMVVAAGTAGSVGWAGWAMGGGYGLLADAVGFGVDQIVGAKIATVTKLQNADEDLLWGIRGAGASLGVICELTIKVHEMPKILAGFIVYKITEMQGVLLKFQELLDTSYPYPLPTELSFHVGLSRREPYGTTLAIIFMWTGPDPEKGQEWHEEMRNLGTVEYDSVCETTFKKFQEEIDHSENGSQMDIHTRSLAITRFNYNAVSVLQKSTLNIPLGRSYSVSIYINHGRSTMTSSSCCFGMRGPHMLLHINASAPDEFMGEAKDWANGLVEELNLGKGILRGGYISFMGPDEPVEECYGGNWMALKKLKKKVDPENFFQYGQPRIPVD